MGDDTKTPPEGSFSTLATMARGSAARLTHVGSPAARAVQEELETLALRFLTWPALPAAVVTAERPALIDRLLELHTIGDVLLAQKA